MTARLDIHRTTENGVDHVPLKAGTNRVKVVSGRQYRLIDPDKAMNADELRVLQVETDMVIENIPVTGSGETASIVLEGYYKVCSASDRCEVLVDAPASGGEPVMLADVNAKAIGARSDGTFVLHDPSFEPPAPPPTDDGHSVRPVLYGLGGAAVLGLALGGGGGGGGDGAPPTGDIPLALKSAAFFNNRFPTIFGTAQPGTDIQLRIDTDGDLRENVTYNTTADAAGNWAVNLQTATPTTGALPAGGLSDANSLAVTATLNGVQNSLPLTTLSFDDVAPAAAEVSPVAEDGIITGPEKAAGVVVSGKAEPGGTVEIVLGTMTKVVAVGADGTWTAPLGATELPAADGEYTMTVTTVDAAGNRATPATSRVVLNTTGSVAAIAYIATDDIVNAAEAASPVNVSGTAEAGASVKVTLGGVEQTVTADANRAWSTAFTLPASLADGDHQVTVETTNAVGNRASSSRTFTLDRTAPARATGISFSDGTTISHDEAEDGTKITGRAEATPGTRVSVNWNGHIETANVGSNGQWEVSFSRAEIPMPLSGSQASQVTVTVQDRAGNTSEPETANVTLEGPPATKPPVINAIATDNRIDATEAAQAITVSGNAEPGARVTITAGTLSASAVAGTDGRWSAPMNLGALADGAYTVNAVATLDGREASTAATQAITVDKADRTPPTLSQLSIPEGPEISAEEARDGFAVSGTAEANATITLTLGSGTGAQTATATAGPDGTWTATFTAAQMPTVAAGATLPLQLTATARDAAGNTSQPQTAQLSFQGAQAATAAPVISVIATDDRINAAEAASPILLSGTAAPNAAVAVTVGSQSYAVNAGANGAWTLSPLNLSTLADGTHTVSATATVAGQTASPATTRTVTIDKTVPTITGLTIDDGTTISATEAANGFVVSGTTEANASVSVTFNGHTGTATAGTNGQWSVSFAADRMPVVPTGGNVALPLTATATDAVGNTSPAQTGTLTIEGAPRAAAQVAISSFAGNDGVSAAEAAGPIPVSGTATPDASVALSIGTTQLGTVTANAAGSWNTTVTLPATLAAGAHTLSATATVAGGSGATGTTATANQDFVLTRATPAPREPEPAVPLALDIAPISEGTVDATEAGSPIPVPGTVTGTGAAGAIVTVSFNGTMQEVSADANGAWAASITIPADMANGTQTVTAIARARDAATQTAEATEDFTLSRPAAPAPQGSASGADTTPTATDGGEASAPARSQVSAPQVSAPQAPSPGTNGEGTGGTDASGTDGADTPSVAPPTTEAPTAGSNTATAPQEAVSNTAASESAARESAAPASTSAPGASLKGLMLSDLLGDAGNLDLSMPGSGVDAGDMSRAGSASAQDTADAASAAGSADATGTGHAGTAGAAAGTTPASRAAGSAVTLDMLLGAPSWETTSPTP